MVSINGISAGSPAPEIKTAPVAVPQQSALTENEDGGVILQLSPQARQQAGIESQELLARNQRAQGEQRKKQEDLQFSAKDTLPPPPPPPPLQIGESFFEANQKTLAARKAQDKQEAAADARKLSGLTNATNEYLARVAYGKILADQQFTQPEPPKIEDITTRLNLFS